MEDSTTEATRTGIDKKIDNFVEGDLEHATEILSALWAIANNDDDIKAPSNTPTPVSSVRFCLLPGVIRVHLYTQSDQEGHESWPLGLCEYRPHQVDTHRGLLRQEVLGQTLQVWGYLETRLFLERDHE